MIERKLYNPDVERRSLWTRLKRLCEWQPRGLRYFSPIHNLPSPPPSPVLPSSPPNEQQTESSTTSSSDNSNAGMLQVKLLELIGGDVVQADKLEIEGLCLRPENKQFNDCVLQLHRPTTPIRLLCTDANILHGVIGRKEWEQACQQQGLVEIPFSNPIYLSPTSEENPWTTPKYHQAELKIRKLQDGRYFYLEFSKLPPNSHVLEVWVEKHDTRFLQELPLIGNTPLSRRKLFSVPTHVANSCWLGIESRVPPSLTRFFAFGLRFTLMKENVFEGDAMVPLFSPSSHSEESLTVEFGASYLKVPPNTPAKPSAGSDVYLKAHLSRQDLVYLDALEYLKLKSILEVTDDEKLGMIANVLTASSGYDWQFVTALGNFYGGSHVFCRLTSLLLKGEIIHCLDSNTLFRAPTLAAKCFEYLLRTSCQQYLQKVISEYYQQRDDDKRPLDFLVTCFVKASIKHAVLIPEHIRWICKEIRSHVATQFPEPTPIHVTCITSFLYLRLLVPCLLNPNLFLGPGLLQQVTKHAATQGFRDVNMRVGKVVQVIANLNGGSNYSKTMPALNQLIISFFPKICLYVMQVSTTTSAETLADDKVEENRNSNSNGSNTMPLLQYYLSQYLTPVLDGWLMGVHRRTSLLSVTSSRSSHSRETPIDVHAQQDTQLTLQKEASFVEYVEGLVEECRRLDKLVEECKQKMRMEEEEREMRVTALGKKVPKNL